MNEERLIRKAAKGDKRAFKHLYHAHVDMVFRVCKRLLICQDEAQETTQEVFVKVWKQLPKFQGESTFKTWVYRIAVNTSVDMLRKNKLKTVDIDEQQGLPITETDLGLVDELCSLIEKLPERSRIVFVLYAIEGHTHKEVADLLGITEGGSKSHFSRAREQLQHWWGNYEVA
ncbi:MULTISPECIES: RNA polymerase sigma factor [Gammaproteobacteria]|uniref:RNA polymerase sigma factor n=1 Tax=Gammaproteobacteria TaxID=1236 RepID=UPI000DCFB52A|nr:MULTISPECIES: RNA polymerase sigma factor [Gammaproteobacteria]RTE85730.1 RNA polymerase sigma factor [Aliidiomarina sp. B3213]TCZ90268.1 RNA polymerase sigma factor [Lysobacter sp. N42]